jgi:hypothetical protein
MPYTKKEMDQRAKCMIKTIKLLEEARPGGSSLLNKLLWRLKLGGSMFKISLDKNSGDPILTNGWVQ